MAIYKHGTYGEFAESVGSVGTQSATVAVYVGAAPVNLVRGFAKYVNAPIKVGSLEAARSALGYSSDWASFDLCEAVHVHLDNAAGNVAPIVCINVLDPAVHRKADVTTASVVFANGQATIESDTIILDTLVLADKVEGTDFALDYDFAKGKVVISSIGTPITGTLQVTYNEVDPTAIDAETIIGGVTAAGVYTGLGCVSLVYPELHLIPSLLLCPKWSGEPTVYEAMVKASQKINGHWYAMVLADIPLVDGDDAVDTRVAAIAWKNTNGYTSEFSKVFWAQGKDSLGRALHASVLWAWRQMQVDADNGGLPMESASNKAIPVVSQFFGEDSTNRGFDEISANELNAEGITTIVFHGGQWVLWGPHTAAYKFGAVVDNRNIFDNSIRMMMHVLNDFQQSFASEIDSPMTRAQADSIKAREQEKLDAWASQGAFIGEPVVEFRESDNSTAELVEGNFVWYHKATSTPPFKSGLLCAAYSTEGFETYFGEVE